MNPKSIYIHMPFCKTKCPYCDFASYADKVQDKHKFKEYTEALINEIQFRLPHSSTRNEIKTIFFGGGTPSLHSPGEYEMIFSILKEYFQFSDDIEITLEANPGTVSRGKLQDLIDAGINRVSIGVQTFDELLLQKLGRGHSLDDSFQTIKDLKSLDLKSWSFDLIYGLPGQSLDSWLATVDKALSFDPPHISSYALSIETSTPYGDIYKNSKHPDLPQEEVLVEMYNQAHELFEKHGLLRYEISNWAKPGHEAKHNLTYWNAEEYYAFGLSSHGYVDSVRYHNTRDIKKYMEQFRDIDKNQTYDFDFNLTEAKQKIPDSEKLEEKLMLNLRLNSGLRLNAEIEKIIDLESLENLKKDDFIQESDKCIKLSDKGVMLSNRVINQLLK